MRSGVPNPRRFALALLLIILLCGCTIYLEMRGIDTRHGPWWLTLAWLAAAWFAYRQGRNPDVERRRSLLEWYLESKRDLPYPFKLVVLAAIIVLLVWILAFSPYSRMMRQLLQNDL